MYNESDIVLCHQRWKLWLLHIIAHSKSIQYICLWLWNFTKHNRANLVNKWIMEVMRQGSRNLRFQQRNIRSAWQKRLGFCLGINRFRVQVWSLPQKENQLLSISTNLKFTNFSEKSKFYDNNWSKPKSDIDLFHTRISGLA